MNIQTLKDYLGHICELEASLYAMQNIRNNVIEKIRSLKNEVSEKTLEMEYLEDFSLSRVIGLGVIGALCGFALAAFYGVKAKIGYDSAKIFLKFGYTKTICLIAPAVFGGATALLALIIGLLEYRSQKKYVIGNNKIIEQKNRTIIENNRKRQELRAKQISVLQSQIEEIDHRMQESRNILESYYNKNILYPKYWNWVAVASFYEYLGSGRCTSLEGPEGAYNKFENERRQNLIIAKLDEVVKHLNAIEENQFMLYSEIKKQNEVVGKLTNDINRCALSLNRIEASTEMIDYNCERAAKNTEFLTWLEIMKLDRK